MSTLDVDIFVAFRPDAGSLLISPAPIFDYLTARGYPVEGEYIMIAGWPVQFPPPTSPLVEEALAGAISVPVGEASVFTAEHLDAIALQVGRGNDKARVLQFVETGVLNPERFQAILAHHQLLEASGSSSPGIS